MKKNISVVMAILLTVFQSSCSRIPEEVPEAILQLDIDDCKEELKFNDCDDLTMEIEHDPDTKNHLDTVNIRFLAEYPYGDYEASISNLVYQYDKSSDNWTLITEMSISDTDVTWKNIDEFYGYYEMPGGYLVPPTPRREIANAFYSEGWWDNYPWEVYISEFTDDENEYSIHLEGSFLPYGAYNPHTFYYDNTYTGFIARRDYSQYHKALVFIVNDTSRKTPTIVITPEQGMTYLINDPTDNGQFSVPDLADEYFLNY